MTMKKRQRSNYFDIYFNSYLYFMKKLVARLTGAAGGLSLMLASATGVLAQYREYTYDATDDAAAASIFGALWLLWCCLGIIHIAGIVFMIVMAIHVFQKAPEDQKIVWVLVVLSGILIPWIGPLIYFLTKKKEWDKK